MFWTYYALYLDVLLSLTSSWVGKLKDDGKTSEWCVSMDYSTYEFTPKCATEMWSLLREDGSLQLWTGRVYFPPSFLFALCVREPSHQLYILWLAALPCYPALEEKDCGLKHLQIVKQSITLLLTVVCVGYYFWLKIKQLRQIYVCNSKYLCLLISYYDFINNMFT